MTSDGGLRSPWRVLLFVALVMGLLWLEGLLFPAISGLEPPQDRITGALVAQTGLVLVAALGAAGIMLRWVDRRPVRGLGFPVTAAGGRELGLGVLVGAGALAVPVLLLTLAGGYRYAPQPGTALAWLATSGVTLAALAVPAASEEALIRGYFFRSLREGPGAVVAVAVTSAVFAALHGGNPGAGPFALVNIFLAGVLLAVAVLRTGTLWLATGVHLGWNWAMAGPLDLPVSGLQGPDMPLYDVVVSGPVWLTGGQFGPEGGLAGTVGVGVGLALVVWITRPGPAGADE